MTSIAVLGCGYLGAVHAACMAKLGHRVVGFDVDAGKIEKLAAGEAPFYEPGLETLLPEVLATGLLEFTSDPARLAGSDVAFVCVGTPQRPGELAADTQYVNAAVQLLVEHLTEPALVVGKSTVPVGTAKGIAAVLKDQAPHLNLAWNPEFLREGYAIEDTLTPDRLVFGIRDAESAATLREVYATPIAAGTPVVEMDFETAELVKVSANAFLATKISFINAMAEVCETTGADVSLLANAIGYDDRIGHKFLGAGLGFGGGCLPKDIRAFMARAGELGVDQALSFLKEVDAINLRRRSRMVDLARAECGGSFVGHKVAVLGASFKPLSDDIRDSPALDVAQQIHEQGGEVVVTDPQALENARRRNPDLTYADTAMEACQDADVVLLLTQWPEYRYVDPAELGSVVRQRRILDGRTALDPAAWRAAGWAYRALGRPRA